MSRVSSGYRGHRGYRLSSPLEKWRQESVHPPSSPAELPWEFPLIVFEAEGVALEFVVFEDAIQFGSGLLVKYEAGGFVVPFERAGIQVHAAHHRDCSINHHDLAVMETALIQEDMSTMTDQTL